MYFYIGYICSETKLAPAETVTKKKKKKSRVGCDLIGQIEVST